MANSIELSERERLLLHQIVYDSRLGIITIAKELPAESTVSQAMMKEAKELEDLEWKLKT